MFYADLKKTDIANGPGVRVSLFVSGCTHRCPGCFNPETWDFQYGRPFTQKTLDELLAALAPDHIRGLSLLGGEPFEPENQGTILDLVNRVQEKMPQKTVWCYTGYLFEELAENRVGTHSRSLLEGLDALVDGPFVLAKKDLGLRFRGSSNQRIIDVPSSLEGGKVQLFEEYMT